MAIQKEDSLDKPLNDQEAPKLFLSSLKPSLSQASINLIIDYKRTLQSDLTKKMFWNFKTWSVLIAGLSVYIYIKFQSLIEYRTLRQVIENSNFKIQVFYMFIATMMIICICFALIGEFTKFLKEEADSVGENLEEVFKFDLKLFALLPDTEEEYQYAVSQQDKKASKNASAEYKKLILQGDNTQVIIYRSVPIAVITVLKDEELSREDQFAVKINALGVRRVYADTDLQQDLIQWAYLRARDMYIKEGNLSKSNGKPVRIFIEVYDFETKILNVLKKLPGWQLIKSEPVKNNFLTEKVFGVKKQVWGIGMNIVPKPK